MVRASTGHNLSETINKKQQHILNQNWLKSEECILHNVVFIAVSTLSGCNNYSTSIYGLMNEGVKVFNI